jgi:ribosomal protein L39E
MKSVNILNIQRVPNVHNANARISIWVQVWTQEAYALYLCTRRNWPRQPLPNRWGMTDFLLSIICG